MKKAILFILFLFSTSIFAQTIDTRKTIEVTGSAEMSIVPDEIELEIILLEYNLNGKKVTLSNIESDFNKILIKKYPNSLCQAYTVYGFKIITT